MSNGPGIVPGPFAVRVPWLAPSLRHLDGETISVVLSHAMTLVSEAAAPVVETAEAEAPTRSARGIEQRLVDATLACIARHGLTKTTIDDIAREAGCSRATVYRYVRNKRELASRALHSESARILGACRAAADVEDTLEDAVFAMFVVAGRELTEHAALRFVADHEPEIILPHLTFADGDRFLRNVADALAPSLERFLGERAHRAAEWVARLGLAMWLSPAAPVSFTDDDALRAYVHEFVVPAIRPVPESVTDSSPHPV